MLKQLEEYWGCIVKDQEVFCPEKCNNCVVCKFLTKACYELMSTYFFSARKDMPYQPYGEFLPMLLTKIIKSFLELKYEKQLKHLI